MTDDILMSLGRAATVADLALDLCLRVTLDEAQGIDVAKSPQVVPLPADSRRQKRPGRPLRARKSALPCTPGRPVRIRMHLLPVPRA
jgi:hypothetical protein